MYSSLQTALHLSLTCKQANWIGEKKACFSQVCANLKNYQLRTQCNLVNVHCHSHSEILCWMHVLHTHMHTELIFHSQSTQAQSAGIRLTTKTQLSGCISKWSLLPATSVAIPCLWFRLSISRLRRICAVKHIVIHTTLLSPYVSVLWCTLGFSEIDAERRSLLFYFILFYFILFYFILFYFILFYFILFYFISFHFILF